MSKLENTVLNHKFAIDKLTARANTTEDALKTCQNKITSLVQESQILSETKTDQKTYCSERDDMRQTLYEVRETASNSESLTLKMVEFIYKFEPIYI